MNFSNFFSSFAITFLLINYGIEVKSEKALIYDYAAALDGVPGDLVEFQNPADLQSCETCIMACPASSKPEKEFDKDDSLTGSSIFLRKTDPNFQIDICDGQFKPGLIWDEKKKFYMSGYELYYDEGRIDLQFDKYENFRKVPIAEIFDSKLDIQDIDMKQYYEEQHPSSDRVNRYKSGRNTIFEILDESSNPQKWVFFFIRVLVIRGKAYTRQITLADREVIKVDKPDQTMTECKDYSIGDDGQTSDTKNFHKSLID
ncbi:uncharacterized protein LOC135848389 [Planococcus citri]|uniref:uncharacterized protein LOC135848389 n=1 Tax=Planococcus citri TaxID=170843 RepID=UPI0031F88E90